MVRDTLALSAVIRREHFLARRAQFSRVVGLGVHFPTEDDIYHSNIIEVKPDSIIVNSTGRKESGPSTMMQKMSTRAMAIAVSMTSALAVLCACHANAEPPKFPDLNAYVAANVDEYVILLPNVGREANKRVYFVTPDGVRCNFLMDSAGCTGDNIPGISDKDKNPYTYVATGTGIRPTASTPFVDGKIQGHELKVLPALHSITVNGVVCGVDDAGTTACKDTDGRGFVLSKRGSTWFPKV